MESALEKTLTSCYKDEMISFMNAHPECFISAMTDESMLVTKSHGTTVTALKE